MSEFDKAINWNNIPLETKLMIKDDFSKEDWKEFDYEIEQERYLKSFESKRRYTTKEICEIFSDDEVQKSEIINTLRNNIMHYTKEYTKIASLEPDRAKKAKSLLSILSEMYLRLTGGYKEAVEKQLINDYDLMIEKVKQIDIVNYVECLGFKVRNNKISCFKHEDKTPSLCLYPKTNSFHCFSCQISGDLIKLVMEYDKINFKEALAKLNQ